MKQIDFYFDFISPYAYLAFDQLPHALKGCSYAVRYKPILFAALLGQYGQLGPAEIPPKRDWTYRQVLWQARKAGVELQMPAQHPFNPLTLLRLALACPATGLPNRYITETIFKHVWQGGQNPNDPDRLADLLHLLPPRAPLDSDEIKSQLKVLTEQARMLNLFGVPTMVVDGKAFWGYDALPMLAAYLAGDPWFTGPEWTRASQVPYGLARRTER